jgi:hypothetical protein
MTGSPSAYQRGISRTNSSRRRWASAGGGGFERLCPSPRRVRAATIDDLRQGDPHELVELCDVLARAALLPRPVPVDMEEDERVLLQEPAREERGQAALLAFHGDLAFGAGGVLAGRGRRFAGLLG